MFGANQPSQSTFLRAHDACLSIIGEGMLCPQEQADVKFHIGGSLRMKAGQQRWEKARTPNHPLWWQPLPRALPGSQLLLSGLRQIRCLREGAQGLSSTGSCRKFPSSGWLPIPPSVFLWSPALPSWTDYAFSLSHQLQPAVSAGGLVLMPQPPVPSLRRTAQPMEK